MNLVGLNELISCWWLGELVVIPDLLLSVVIPHAILLSPLLSDCNVEPILTELEIVLLLGLRLCP